MKNLGFVAFNCMAEVNFAIADSIFKAQVQLQSESQLQSSLQISSDQKIAFLSFPL